MGFNSGFKGLIADLCGEVSEFKTRCMKDGSHFVKIFASFEAAK